jgi:hypothetical protein
MVGWGMPYPMQMVGGDSASAARDGAGSGHVLARSPERPRGVPGALGEGASATQPNNGLYMFQAGGQQPPSPTRPAHDMQSSHQGDAFNPHHQQPGMRYYTPNFGQHGGYQQVPPPDYRMPGTSAAGPSGSTHQHQHHYHQQPIDHRYMPTGSDMGMAHPYPAMGTAPATMGVPSGYPYPTHPVNGGQRGDPRFAAPLRQDGAIPPPDSRTAGAARTGTVVERADDDVTPSELSER